MSYDEGAHLYAGYQHWTARDFGVNPEHPPLVKLVAAAPLLGMTIKPAAPPRFLFLVEQYTGGQQMLAENGDYRLLTRARIAASLFTFALALLIFAAGWEMFGPLAGLLALTLFTFEPTILAHGALVTTDMGVACFTFASVYAFYRYLKRPGWLRVVLCGLAVGLALSAKLNGVLVLPIIALIALWEIATTPSHRAQRAASLFSAVLAVGLIGYVVLWSFYTFRYEARPNGLTLGPPLAAFVHMGPSPWQASLVTHLAAWHLLPEAYLFGWTKLATSFTEGAGFLFGHIYPRGTWLYFPAALLIKSTLTLILLLVAATFALKRFRREAVILAIALFTILIACLPAHVNIGVRHVLAIYPFAILLAAAAALQIARRSRYAAAIVSALFVFQCATSLHAYPDYLPYANEAFGGSSRTYRMLTDSNVDWAQQLKEVNAWTTSHHVTDCWFAYSYLSGAPPYDKTPCRPLPTGLAMLAGQPSPVVPSHLQGTLLVSAEDAAGVLWGPGSLNPYRQFQDGQPSELIGHSVLVYEGSFDVPLLAAESHLSQVPLLMRMGNSDAALKEAEAAIAIAPQAPLIEAALGGTLLQLHRVPEAKQAFGRAMQESAALSKEDSDATAVKIAQMEQPPH
ncbi:phospholipid carrier-dependent glycosyltransferase [Granulicella sibirica]|nr:phospholipid carrier-dependent glycosyltransferase [Granulicella sibirica]